MISKVPSIAWPVWFMVVLRMATISGYPIAMARELFLVMLRY